MESLYLCQRLMNEVGLLPWRVAKGYVEKLMSFFKLAKSCQSQRNYLGFCSHYVCAIWRVFQSPQNSKSMAYQLTPTSLHTRKVGLAVTSCGEKREYNKQEVFCH